MTLVRVGWGAASAIWALTLLPDVDPFFTDGALLYDRDLRDGAWNLLPHLGWEHAGLATCLLLLAASLTTMVGLKTRLSSLVAVLCLVVLQRANAMIFNSGDLLLRLVGIAVVLSPCGLLWSVDAALDRRRGRRRELCRGAVRHAAAPARGGRGLPAVGVGEGAGDHLARGHRGGLVAPHRGPAALRGARLAVRPGRAPQPVHLGDPRLRGDLHRVRVAAAHPACGCWASGCCSTSASTSSSTSASSASRSTSPTSPSSRTDVADRVVARFDPRVSGPAGGEPRPTPPDPASRAAPPPLEDRDEGGVRPRS